MTLVVTDDDGANDSYQIDIIISWKKISKMML